MKKFLLVLAISAFLSSTAHAGISFTNGYWSTTFNCTSDQVFNQSSPYSPDIQCPDIPTGDLKAGWSAGSRCGNQHASITADANYPGGDGGRGYRNPIQMGPYNNNANGTDGYLIWTFSNAQSEFWVRWYQRFPAGTKFNHGKDLYVFTTEKGKELMWHYSLYTNKTDWRVDWFGNYNCVNGCSQGLSDLEGPYGFDGQWHQYELYVKIKGNGGVLTRFWFDGSFIEEYESNGGGPSTPIKTFYMKQAVGVDGSGCSSYDIDDIAIASPSFNGFVTDSRGNKMIGPLGGGGNFGGGGGGSLDTTPPTVAVTSPTNNQNVSGGITITASASDNVSVSGVQFKVDGADYGAEDTTNNYSISLDTNALSDGNHALVAVARDAAGNVTTSQPVNINVSNGGMGKDTAPPSIEITTPSPGQSVSGTIPIAVNATDDTGVIGVQFMLDGASFGSEILSSPYTIDLDTATYADGNHTITAIARDAVGNETTANDVSITINNTTDSGSANSVAVLFAESFEDNNLASRGWYDNTNLTVTRNESASNSIGALEFQFNAGDTSPTSGGTIRRKFPETDSVYLKYYLKFSSDWDWDDRNHMIYMLTNKDGDWTGPAYTYQTVYIEQDKGEPYFAIQDSRNIDLNNIGIDLTDVTENRAVAGCNGANDEFGEGTCYAIGGAYRNGKFWKPGQPYFGDANWHLVEVFIKLNSVTNGTGIADGIIQYWVDGGLVLDHNSVMFRTAQNADMKFNQFLIGPYIGSGASGDQKFWIDELTLADAPPSGGASSGSEEGDTAIQPPPIPGGLKISAY